ncbi:hypothetical protein AFK68_28125 [Hydrocoleum sp. CS-953]|nr:hypothetical protein AFK68_28125 [Hydrocoleum sp. CS-953]
MPGFQLISLKKLAFWIDLGKKNTSYSPTSLLPYSLKRLFQQTLISLSLGFAHPYFGTLFKRKSPTRNNTKSWDLIKLE